MVQRGEVKKKREKEKKGVAEKAKYTRKQARNVEVAASAGECMVAAALSLICCCNKKKKKKRNFTEKKKNNDARWEVRHKLSIKRNKKVVLNAGEERREDKSRAKKAS